MRFIEGAKGKKSTKIRKEKQNEKVSHKREKLHRKATEETLHKGRDWTLHLRETCWKITWSK